MPIHPSSVQRPESIGTNHHVLHDLGVLTPKANGAESAPGAYAELTSEPASLTALASGVVVFKCERDDNALVQVYHTHASEANDLNSIVHVWGVRRLEDGFHGVYLGSVDVLSGQAERAGHAANLSGWGQTVAPTSSNDYTLEPGMRTIGGPAAADGIQGVLFDKAGFEWLIFQAEAGASAPATGVGICVTEV